MPRAKCRYRVKNATYPTQLCYDSPRAQTYKAKAASNAIQATPHVALAAKFLVGDIAEGDIAEGDIAEGDEAFVVEGVEEFVDDGGEDVGGGDVGGGDVGGEAVGGAVVLPIQLVLSDTL